MIETRDNTGSVRVEMENAWGSTYEYLSPEEAEKLGRRLILQARKARTRLDQENRFHEDERG